ncbi:BtpA/SgcQ family protein [Frigidibacter sp.]|uniref:BtpA/SgcQ family protein n=1 Tax=Frigidibacter sp. TaxID=2586418 RepID=UPI0027351848|nr:BtpA/SgcQ family protein [Frigidibacter sp.]MDP3339342.1 BtpA/SgcQ family protein [Frigidibacter sp.]
MDRSAFHRLFKSPGPVVTPVIHVLGAAQALRNISTAARLGAPGIFLINHDFPVDQFLPILREVRAACPDIWLGVNFLAQSGRSAFPVLGQLAAEGFALDAYWADDAGMDERQPTQSEAEAIAAIRDASGWRGLYFGGVCFKKQRPVDPALNEHSAHIARPFMEVVTTSGLATGHAADMDKITAFRRGLGPAPLAVASGITPDNAASYAADVDCFLVATGINHPGDFYTIDPARLAALLDLSRDFGAPRP